MILKKVNGVWLGEFRGFASGIEVTDKISGPLSRDPDVNAIAMVIRDVKQAYLRSIATPGKRCSRNGEDFVIMNVYDHYLVSDGKGPLEGFATLDWIEGSEW